MTTSIWLCQSCGDMLQSYNLKYGVLYCEGCGATLRVGEDVWTVHDAHVPPTPDPESDDE